jgi:hypothetical protein
MCASLTVNIIYLSIAFAVALFVFVEWNRNELVSGFLLAAVVITVGL